MKNLRLQFLYIISGIIFVNAGDVYTESSFLTDNGAQYVIIKGPKVIDIINKNLEYDVTDPIANLAPLLKTGGDTKVCLGQSKAIKSTATDSDGSVAFYTWTEGDKVISREPNFTYKPTTAGVKSLTLSARDDQGAVSTETIKVRVSRPPVVDAGKDQKIEPDKTANLIGSIFDDGTISSIKWTESKTLLGDTEALAYKPKKTGKHTLTLTATDNNGCTGSDSTIITVAAKRPPNEPDVVKVGKCNNQNGNGGDKPERFVYSLPGISSFDFKYDTRTMKDRMIVYQGDEQIFDTGCQGTKGYWSKHIVKDPNIDEIIIDVKPNCPSYRGSGTRWYMKLVCPKKK